MKIVYLAKHGQNNNDDEGAIAHAFRVLGHEVACFNDRSLSAAMREPGDFILYHSAPHLISRLAVCDKPSVFWYFDLINANDRTPDILTRSIKRMRYIQKATEISSIGFCTDGDWVANDKSGKLHWLMQGADERIVGRGNPLSTAVPPLMFPGMHRGNGKARERFVDGLVAKYKEQYGIVTNLYREQLRDYIASTEIVICPNSPVTDRYWSNRVYMCAGFRGCILHPYSKGLAQHFTSYEVAQYIHMNGLHSLIDFHNTYKYASDMLSVNALERVKKEHLYRHRIETMLSIMQTKGII